MAAITTTLFFKSNRVYGVGGITFDLILSENHSFGSTVTQFKIEDGSNISDHLQKETRSGSITGLITNFSITDGLILSNKAQDVYEKLKELHNKQELVSIVSVMEVYNNVAVTSVTVPRDSATGEAIEVGLSFQEVQVVKLLEIQIEAAINLDDMGSDLNRQSSVKQDLGKTIPPSVPALLPT